MSSMQPAPLSGTVPGAVPSAEKPLSELGRVVDTFLAPSRTFSDILRRASWWLPLLLLVLSTWTAAFMVERQVGFDQVVQNALSASPKRADAMNGLPPEQKGKQMAAQVTGTRIVFYALPVVLVLTWVLYSLAVWGVFNFVLGASTRFAQVFAVTLYAALPYLLYTAVLGLTLYLGNSAETYDSQNPVGTNLAYYIPGLAPWSKVALASLDVVKLWSLALMIVGMAIISRKSILQSGLIIGGFWVLGVLLAVGSAAAFS